MVPQFHSKAKNSGPRTLLNPERIASFNRAKKAHRNFSLQPFLGQWPEHPRVLVLCMSGIALGSGPYWSGLEEGTFQFRDPLSQERHLVPSQDGFMRFRR